MCQNLQDIKQIFLDDILTGTGFLRRPPQLAVVIIGDDYDSRFRIGGKNLSGRRNAVNVFHPDIHQNPIGLKPRVCVQSLRSVRAFADDICDIGERHFNKLPHRLTVIND